MQLQLDPRFFFEVKFHLIQQHLLLLVQVVVILVSVVEGLYASGAAGVVLEATGVPGPTCSKTGHIFIPATKYVPNNVIFAFTRPRFRTRAAPP